MVAARTEEGNTCNKGSLSELPLFGEREVKRQIREDRCRPTQMADGPVLLMKAGNSAGGKGPWCKASDGRDNKKEIDHASTNP